MNNLKKGNSWRRIGTPTSSKSFNFEKTEILICLNKTHLKGDFISMKNFILTILFVMVLPVVINAATVRVDSVNGNDTTPVNIGGFDTYATLKAAWLDIGTWGDGTNDTIQIHDNTAHGLEFTGGAGDRPLSPSGSTLTITNVPTESPIVQTSGRGFYFVNDLYLNKEFIFDGITFIPNNNGNRIFSLDRPVTGGTTGDYTITIRNSVLTSHTGNVPNVAFTSTGAGRAGAMPLAWIFIGEDHSSGDDYRLTVNIEDSTLAFSLQHGIDCRNMNARILTGSSINVSNCLFSGSGFASILTVDSQNTLTVNVDDSVFYASNLNGGGDADTGALTFTRSGASTNPEVNVTDSIFWNNTFQDISMTTYIGTLTADRCTFYTTNPGPSFTATIRERDNNPTGGTFNITDCIFGGTAVRQAIQFFGDFTVAATIQTCAVVGSAAVGSSNDPDVDAAWTSNFITTDPSFVSTSDVPLNTTIGWDRTGNDFMDVSDVAYAGYSSTPGERPGNAMAGGADPQGAAVPVELSGFSID